jgi:hypothetical protein
LSHDPGSHRRIRPPSRVEEPVEEPGRGAGSRSRVEEKDRIVSNNRSGAHLELAVAMRPLEEDREALAETGASP